jgi:hypothetical protein
VIGGVAAYFLLTAFGPRYRCFTFLFLLACPLMHIFMHGGHGHHHRNKKIQTYQIIKNSSYQEIHHESCGIGLWFMDAGYH